MAGSWSSLGSTTTPSATEAFGVLRYLGNGALDASFGTGGRASANFTNFLNSPDDVALQPDGKIVVAGNAQSADGTVSEFAVARFNANGTLDGSFGAGGKVTTNFVGVMDPGPCPRQLLRPVLRPGQRAAPAVLPAAGPVRLHQGGTAMSTFTSNFAPQIEAMLDWRTSLGHVLRDMRNAMAGFDRFCASHYPGETVLTRELATAWCQDTATGTWGACRTRAIREFGKYLQLTGADAFIVPSAWIASPVRSLPHMFTDGELAAFFRAADSIAPEYRSPFREYTIPVIFRLILGAGLRPPEARRLRRRDVDTGNAMVMIERSKRNKDRRVPVSGDLAGLLARFDHLADLRHPDREWFFEDQHGRQYSPEWLIAGYHLCCERAGGIAPASTPTRCGTITPPAP
jgi:integrase/recombinase XerD